MNISLVIAVKLSHGRHIVALHYTKTVFEGLLKYMISGLYIKYRSTSQVRTSAMLLLLTVGN